MSHWLWWDGLKTPVNVDTTARGATEASQLIGPVIGQIVMVRWTSESATRTRLPITPLELKNSQTAIVSTSSQACQQFPYRWGLVKIRHSCFLTSGKTTAWTESPQSNSSSSSFISIQASSSTASVASYLWCISMLMHIYAHICGYSTFGSKLLSFKIILIHFILT